MIALETPIDALLDSSHGKPKLLVVDDQPINIQVMHQVFGADYQVFMATNGNQALSICQANPPDLVLLDVSMPGLNGWEVAERLRTRFGRDIRILMVSGNAAELVGSHGNHDGFVLKPVDQQLLFDMLSRQLALVWQHEGTPRAPNAAASLPPAAQPHLAELARLARTGHVRGLTSALLGLAQAVPEAAGLVHRLTEALDDYDLANFQALLAQQQTPDANGEPTP